eukprot:6214746-Pleurochrysis_carterae.AAC.2
MLLSQTYVGNDAMMDGLLSHLARGYIVHLAPVSEPRLSGQQGWHWCLMRAMTMLSVPTFFSPTLLVLWAPLLTTLLPQLFPSPPTSPMPPAEPLPAHLTSAPAAAGNEPSRANAQGYDAVSQSAADAVNAAAPTAAPASAATAASGPLAEPALAAGDRCEVAVWSDQGACTTGLIFKKDFRSGALLLAFDDSTWDKVPAADVARGGVLRMPHDSESRNAVGQVIRSSTGVMFPEAYLYGPKQRAVVTTAEFELGSFLYLPPSGEHISTSCLAQMHVQLFVRR